MDKQTLGRLFADGFNHIPVYRQTQFLHAADALSIFAKLAYQKPYCYLLQSSHDGGRRWGRYSVIGLCAQRVIKVFDHDIELWQAGRLISREHVNNPLDWIEEFKNNYRVPKLPDLPDFSGGLVGYFGYESVRYIERRLREKPAKPGLDVADILLMVSSDVLVFDNQNRVLFLITHISHTDEYEAAQIKLKTLQEQLDSTDLLPDLQIQYGSEAADFTSDMGQAGYERAVNVIKDYICQGDLMQVVPSHHISGQFTDEPLAFYRSLTALNPSPYMYYMHLDDMTVVGSSPEILTRIEGRKATVRPLAGTRRRGANQAEDRYLEQELLADEKEIAEHLMLIDLGRNDLGRVAKTGSVKVTKKMQIERYSHVMHIVSNVECELKDNASAIDVFKATFPAGTLSGAPKIRAMEIIDELEERKRNLYAGTLGYISWHDNMDLAIIIRTAVIKNKVMHIQAGGGIVHDSVPDKEWQETLHKAGAVIKAAAKS